MDLSGRQARWFALAAAVLIVLVASLPTLAVSATGLVERGAQYDGRLVSYQGEVIGDVMRRGNRMVVNVHDGTYAIGVWTDAAAGGEVTRPGRYGMVGDVVRVYGTFHRACPEHGGDTDIHAQTLTVLTSGREVREPFHRRRASAAAILAPLALGLAVWARQRNRRLPDASRA